MDEAQRVAAQGAVWDTATIVDKDGKEITFTLCDNGIRVSRVTPRGPATWDVPDVDGQSFFRPGPR